MKTWLPTMALTLLVVSALSTAEFLAQGGCTGCGDEGGEEEEHEGGCSGGGGGGHQGPGVNLSVPVLFAEATGLKGTPTSMDNGQLAPLIGKGSKQVQRTTGQTFPSTYRTVFTVTGRFTIEKLIARAGPVDPRVPRMTRAVYDSFTYGAGITCGDGGSTCAVDMPAGGVKLGLDAVSSPGFTFEGWTGQGCGPVVTLTTPLTCTAVFSKKQQTQQELLP